MNRLYETDSYINELETTVTDSGTDEDGRYFAVLEDTIFFPKEGGQNADTGTLVILESGSGSVQNGSESAVDDRKAHEIRVLDGIISGRNTCSAVRSGSEISIRYILSEPVPAGARVLCRLDSELRFVRMQNHSGEHILSGIIHRKYGYDNVGFHLSDTDFVTLDFNGTLTYDQVIGCEAEANRAIYANMPIRASFPSKEELDAIDYRSKIDIEDQVRLITVGDDRETVDICACCAPHVARTGEIGILKVFSVINWKGGIRISMLCGKRALEYINKEHDILTETARSLSTESVNIPQIVNSQRFEISELKGKLAEALERGVIDRIEAAGADGPGCLFVGSDFPAASMKNIYNILTAKFDGYVGVFAGDDKEGYRYNAGIGNGDSRELAAGLKDTFGAKGGGNAEMIQGKISACREEIISFFDRFSKRQ